jgi:hypothetical protein
MDTVTLTFSIIACLFIDGMFAVHLQTRRLRRLAEIRTGESICTFSRSLDYRGLDTKVIRAVYEGLQDYFNYIKRPLPVRPSDQFEQELWLYPGFAT